VERLGESVPLCDEIGAKLIVKHEGKLPEYEQKDEFKKFLNSWRKKSDEENFDEADNKAYYVTQKSEVS
jgi:endonuclease IV